MKHHVRRHIHKARSAISAPDYFKILILRTIGNFLILASLFMIVKTFYQPVSEEIRFYFDSIQGKKYVVSTDIDKIEKDYAAKGEKGKLAELLKNRQIELVVPKDAEFGIVIPKIAANASVISNVNPANNKEYLAALKNGVAHAQGTAFPGQGGHIYMFAHSTDYFWNVSSYNAVFYLLYKLENDDEVDVFYKGARYLYKVVDKKIIDPSQTQFLSRQTSEEFLTLQTCWPPGTTLKRLLIFAKRVAE